MSLTFNLVCLALMCLEKTLLYNEALSETICTRARAALPRELRSLSGWSQRGTLFAKLYAKKIQFLHKELKMLMEI